MERLVIFLFNASGNTPERHDLNSHAISYGARSQSISKIIDALHAALPGGESFVQRNIKLPTEEQARRQARLFFELSGFPRDYPEGMVWATIDGTVSILQLLKIHYLYLYPLLMCHFWNSSILKLYHLLPIDISFGTAKDFAPLMPW